MGWLYRGQFSQAYAVQVGKEGLGFMGYPLKMLRLLLDYGIKPICVFDGRPHEGKMATEKQRAIDKAKNKELAEQAAKKGNEQDAKKYSTRCLVVKQNQVDLFMEILNLLKIEHLTAPYEADAQMAFMVREKMADFAITEDSDLIAFGCPRVVLKMNWNGFGQLFDIESFRKNDAGGKAWDPALRTLQKVEHDEFVNLCVMGGCEYLQSIERVGLKVVLKHLLKVKTCEAVLGELKKSKTMKDRVPAGYWEDVCKVRTIFKYQTVYDPHKKSLVPLEAGEGFDQEYVGALIDADDVETYAAGKLDMKTLQAKDLYIDVVDADTIRQDWKDNAITEKTLKCLDPSFYTEEKPSNRHGIYAQSSKDWPELKLKLLEEVKELKGRTSSKEKTAE